MDYQIALSPEIDVDVEEFVSAWNNEDKCREAADAQLKEAGSVSFVEPGTMAIFLGGVAAKFAIDVFKDLVKEQVIKILKDKFGRDSELPKIEIISVEVQDDGSKLILVKKHGEYSSGD